MLNTEDRKPLFSLAFSKDEFADRREKLLARMRAENIDAVVVTSAANYYYLCGLALSVPLGTFALIIRKDGQGYWVIRKIEITNLEEFVEAAGWSEVAKAVGDEENSEEEFSRAITRVVGEKARVGFELSSRSVSFSNIQAVARDSSIEIWDVTPMIESLRMVKTPKEIEYLARSGEMTAAAMNDTIAALKDGVTDSQLAAQASYSLLSRGSDTLTQTPFVTAGLRSALAHSTSVNERILPGEIVNFEFSSVVERYCTPVFRGAVLGQPSNEIRDFHDASLAALNAALAGFAPGMTSHDADRVLRAELERTGYAQYSLCRAAYSIGIGYMPSWDEDHIMKVREHDQRILQPGMCFHIVPSMYKLGLGGVCCSMSVVMTETGTRNLVPHEPKLYVVD